MAQKIAANRDASMKLVNARFVTNRVIALAEFYSHVLGVSSVGSDDYVEFRLQHGVAIAISSKRSIDLFGGGAAEPAANRSVILDFQVDDVDRQRCRLASFASSFVVEPTDQPWGSRAMLFRDPDGNLINFFAPIGRASIQ
jgi:predicted enzyme related to lactoylglutathione lyase